MYLCDSMPCPIMNLISTIIQVIKIAAPIILIVYGMLDLGKAVVSNKDEEMKKQKNMFIKRLITVVLLFLTVSIVELTLNIVTFEEDGIVDCISTIISPNHKDNYCTS